jgi:protein ImuB
VVAPGASPVFLAPLPVATLGDPDLGELLVRLGMPTLGDFARLPAGAVLTRFGEHGAYMHARASGRDPRPSMLTAPPPDLVETIELDPPAARVDEAAFAAKALADRLLARLDEQHLSCSRVIVEAETEHGERLVRCWRHEGALTPGALAERVRWQLDAWLTTNDTRDAQDEMYESTTGGLILLRLAPDEVAPARGSQLGFWGNDARTADRADRVLARVQGMLGYDAVVTPVLQGGRTPAERVRWVPWGEPREPARPVGPGGRSGGEVPEWPGTVPGPAPARVFDPPLPADLLDRDGLPVRVTGRGEGTVPAALHSAALPGGGGAVATAQGPWVHDVRWWDPRAHRRCARWQLRVEIAGGETVDCLVVVERGRAGIEGISD